LVFFLSYLTQLFRWSRKVLNRVVIASWAAVVPDAIASALRPNSDGAFGVAPDATVTILFVWRLAIFD
jgi:hypothetical protein